jgi:HD-GYP domain-containing protein (c-di-GMP phosphodiesterase class II)
VEKLVDTKLLKPGVFVTKLDRPWLGTPFLLQGFLIQTEREVDELRRYCRRVYIDPVRGFDVGEDAAIVEPAQPTPLWSAARLAQPPRDAGTTREFAATSEFAADSAGRSYIGVAKHAPWPYRVGLPDELQRTYDLHRDTRAVVSSLLNDVRLGKSLDVPMARQAVAEMAESILRNPNALTLLTQLRAQAEYVPNHCLNVCIFSLVFGRHLGLAKTDLYSLGLGGLLHDIGYVKIPPEVHEKPGRLTAEEFDVVKTHVDEGVDILENTDGIPRAAIEVVRNHHERFDGSGYPRGLKGGAIGLYGLICAITDVYDAVTTDRPWRLGFTPYDALRNVYQRRQRDFDEILVLRYVQCIGIYPVGSLVELNTGDVGTVIDSHPRHRLLPKVMVLLDRHGQRYRNGITVDLLHQQVSSTVQPLRVRAAVHRAQYGIATGDLLAAGMQG